MWEEVYPDHRSGLNTALWRVLSALACGPCMLLSPVERLRWNEQGRYAAAPRLFVIAKGQQDGEGRWHLRGYYACYDRQWKGCVPTLVIGKSMTLDQREIDCVSPATSQCTSPARSSRAPSPQVKATIAVNMDFHLGPPKVIDGDDASPTASPKPGVAPPLAMHHRSAPTLEAGGGDKDASPRSPSRGGAATSSPSRRRTVGFSEDATTIGIPTSA
eukprot:TRINITY_DN13185_c0_g1_i1.p1 TRINITY_DN13185_c0_g1~~TRINITY_DN13185_c0_g1_i1.p1  ORF type:complete len:216 (+),score=16.42 TRINITY_DN13185_c0_g1_i1:518-1165(+)